MALIPIPEGHQSTQDVTWSRGIHLPHTTLCVWPVEKEEIQLGISPLMP